MGIEETVGQVSGKAVDAPVVPVVRMEPVLDVCGNAGRNSIFLPIEHSEGWTFVSKPDRGLPFTVGPVPEYARKSRRVRFCQTFVALVLRLRNGAKVCNSVVGSVAVDMVNLDGFRSVNHNPNHSVCVSGQIENRPGQITAARNSPKSWFASQTIIPALCRKLLNFSVIGEPVNSAPLPNQLPRFRVVVQKFTKQLLGDMSGVSHYRVTSRWWLDHGKALVTLSVVALLIASNQLSYKWVM